MSPMPARYAQHIQHLQERYSRLLDAHHLDAMIVHSGNPRPRSSHDDQSWSLRVTPHFAHWLPLQVADCALVVQAGLRPTLIWNQPGSFWEGPPEPEHRLFLDHLEVKICKTAEDLRAHLPLGRLAWVSDSRDAPWSAGIGIATASLLADLDELRVHKTGWEVACIAEANARAAAGHDALREAFAAGGDVELDLHLAYLRATRQDDPETPYKNIVAVGEHASVLHHVSYGRSPSGRGAQSLLVDAGATCMGYHADITRTWLRGADSALDTFAQLVQGLERDQLQLCEGVRVGRPYQDLHDESHQRLGRLLCDVGVLKTSPDEAVAKDITWAFYPHGLGHSLGLQTHDVGCARIAPRADNPWLRNTRPIEVGQVFTVEPGVYFIDALLLPLRQGPLSSAINWPLVDVLTPFGGIRIEDDLHVGSDGVHNLTRIVLPQGGGQA